MGCALTNGSKAERPRRDRRMGERRDWTRRVIRVRYAISRDLFPGSSGGSLHGRESGKKLYPWGTQVLLYLEVRHHPVE